MLAYSYTQYGSSEYDMVVDNVGTLPWARAKHAIRDGGKMVLITGITTDMFLGGIKARLTGKRMAGGVASEHRDILEAVVRLAAQATEGLVSFAGMGSWVRDDRPSKVHHGYIDRRLFL